MLDAENFQQTTLKLLNNLFKINRKLIGQKFFQNGWNYRIDSNKFAVIFKAVYSFLKKEMMLTYPKENGNCVELSH